VNDVYFYAIGRILIGLAALAVLALVGWMVFKK
jgi:hypothetical protein